MALKIISFSLDLNKHHDNTLNVCIFVLKQIVLFWPTVNDAEGQLDPRQVVGALAR
jgi:hypothetical protein